jgi:pimeloyl-ACP methyl ester carboxylesterase
MPLPIRNSRIRLSQGLLFWREVGQGPALIFLHGSWEEGSQWLPLFEFLAHEFHCFAPDLLGFGESECPLIQYSIALEVECLAEYLEALRLRQVYIVGHSLGAWIATSYALKYPERVKGLILLAPEGLEVRELRYRWWSRWWLSKSVVIQVLRSLAASRLFRFKRVIQLLEIHQQMLDSPIARKLLFQRRRAELTAEQLQERLPWLKLPVLVLQSEKEGSNAAILSQTFAHLAPQAELKKLFPATPDGLQTRTDTIADYIQAFVRRTLELDS